VFLQQFSLVDVSDGDVSMHRLVQAVVRDRLPSDEDRRRWATIALRVVNEAFPDASDEIGTWDDCARVLPHALAVVALSESVEPEVAGRMLNRVGLYLRGRGRFTEAQGVLERAAELLSAVRGPEDSEVATVYGNLGRVRHDQEDRDGARAYFERAMHAHELSAQRQNVPDDSTRRALARDLNDLGSVLLAQDQLAVARQHLERALALDRSIDPTAVEVARDLVNLARVDWKQGDLVKASELLHQAVALYARASGGTEDVLEAGAQCVLAQVESASGEYDSARARLERVLRIRLAKFGEDHPGVTEVQELLRVLPG
jgi:Tfp pilus assembly protein PilF